MKINILRKQMKRYQKKANINTINNEKPESVTDVIRDEVITHGIYVSNMAGFIGAEMNMPEDNVYELALAGMLHDIGKVKIRNYIIGDNDQSMVRRMRYVRLHSIYGYDILKEKGYSDFVLKSVYHHHENYDGSGYPENLSGDEIPVGARILRVADIFVALVSDRPYRPAFDTKTAVELMIDEVKNFDIEVFLAFQRVINRIDTDRDIKKIKLP